MFLKKQELFSQYKRSSKNLRQAHQFFFPRKMFSKLFTVFIFAAASTSAASVPASASGVASGGNPVHGQATCKLILTPSYKITTTIDFNKEFDFVIGHAIADAPPQGEGEVTTFPLPVTDTGNGSFETNGTFGKLGVNDDGLKAIIESFAGRSFDGLQIPSWKIESATCE
ncbi:hypothetical protein L218DRAFT_992568 [Marasmius fiardii PR-910]|nr:hypothetical protein L218DRAFT_992568 [Marasmius fiardii PR-910]